VVDDKRQVPFKENSPPVVLVGMLLRVSQEEIRKVENERISVAILVFLIVFNYKLPGSLIMPKKHFCIVDLECCR
jgi:hypothetical protein